ncbi:class I SAM-dependent methyltransferase [Dactylosporangium sp. NPDC048998]|uniref:class I SAM-dependent methyltransferase n=1 Tax=Dactylosporangium sp. NPDC048998 TaxID=3363976 RepID=UPI00371F3D01
MPTPSSPEAEPHRLRTVAESFGADAERYNRARPSYPDALVERIVAESPGRSVLDVGCGTGIVARQFQAAGCTVLGIDPDPRMAEEARRHGLDVEVATIEAWEPAGRSFDALVAGQAWHWVDPVAGAAKAAAVLRPGGRLALFWNAFEPPPDLAEGFAAVCRRVVPDLPMTHRWSFSGDDYAQLAARPAEAIRAGGAFGEPEDRRFPWEREYTRDEWLDQVPTSGGASRLPSDTLAEILAGFGAVVDAAGGAFTMRYTTVAVTAARS